MKICRTFRLNEFPPELLGRFQPVLVRVGFLYSAPTELLIRKIGNNVTLIPGFPELEGWSSIGAPVFFFDRNWPKITARAEMRRYEFFHGDRYLNLDEGLGKHAGLFLLRCEFDSEAQAAGFIVPFGVQGVDVSSNERYTDKGLAQFGMPA